MNDKSELINSIRERYRLLSMSVRDIDRQLEKFPDHTRSIVIKEIKGKLYYYLQWRQEGKVHSVYLNPVYPGAVAELEAEIIQQKELEQQRAQTLRMIAYLERMLRYMDNDRKKEKIIEDHNFELYWKDHIVSRVSVRGHTAYISRFVKHPAHQLFASDKMSRDQVNRVLEMRCWDRNRPDLRELLAHIGLSDYNPYEIVRRTHGVSWNDYLWFRFPGETLSAKDVLVRT